MDQNVQDYLFDLQGYLVLENAISAAGPARDEPVDRRPRILCRRAVVRKC